VAVSSVASSVGGIKKRTRKLVVAKNAYIDMRCANTSAHMLARFALREGVWTLNAVENVQPRGSGISGENTEISGDFAMDPQYEGCPNCRNSSFVRCSGCGMAGCWSGTVGEPFTCKACGQNGIVSEEPITGLNVADHG
jgi:hypothetical protein